MVFVALLDSNNIVQRVEVVGLFEQAAQVWGEGNWVVLNPDNNEYAGIGWWWNGDRCWPMRLDVETETLWCPVAIWDPIPNEEQMAFCEATGLNCLPTGQDYVVFIGRPITDEDMVALMEVLGL